MACHFQLSQAATLYNQPRPIKARYYNHLDFSVMRFFKSLTLEPWRALPIFIPIQAIFACQDGFLSNL
jgi:hypothetical protein